MDTLMLPKLSSPEHYFTALSVIPTPAVVVDFDTGIIIYANPCAVKLFGRPLDELKGQHQSILHPHDASQTENPFETQRTLLLEHEIYETYEGIAVHKSGQRHHVEIIANLAKLEHDRLLIGIFHVIDQRYEAKLALQKKTDEFEALFENSQVGIMLLKGNRVLDKANQHMAEILGYSSPEELNGLSMESLHLSKERFEAYGKANYDTLNYHKNLHIDYQLRKKNGDPIWCRLSGVALDKNIPANLSKGVIWVVDDISDIKAAEAALTVERNLFRSGPTVIFQRDPSPGWPVKYVSPNAQKVLGYEPNDFLKKNLLFSDLIHPDEIERVLAEFETHCQNRAVQFQQIYPLKIKSGDYRKFYDYTLVNYDSQGNVESFYGYLIDMTDYLKAQELSSLLLNSTNEGIFGIDKSGTISFVNPATTKILGYTEKEMIGTNAHNLFHYSDELGHSIPHKDCQIMRPIKTGEDQHSTHEVLWRKDGSSFPVEYHSTAVYRENEIVGAVISFHNISRRRAQEQRIKYLAFHDELTGLPNRRLFSEHLQKELEREKHDTNRSSLMILDIDHFKDINDTLGHPVGDELLKAITERITKTLSGTDSLARMGGDEFAILTLEEGNGIDATQMAERILSLFKTPFQIHELLIPISTSIGIAFCEPEYSVDDIISQADIALYQAKYAGRNNFVFYEPEMSHKIHEDVEVLNALQQATHEESFELYYQPQIDTITEKVVGVEALIRWFPENERIQDMSSPARFIPIAETRGLIHDITLWQIIQLEKDIQAFRATGFNGRVSINISGELLSHIENLVELLEAIEHSDIAFHELEFEITETAYAKLTSAEISVLDEVRKQGLDLGIDDFGTGYSSLVSLRQFHSSHLKIDKAFIDEVHNNNDDYAIVSATISMAHNLGKRVIAEGVETKEQLKVLKELNCDIIQGFYYAKPMPLNAVCNFIQKQ